MVGALSPEWVAHTGNKVKQYDIQPKNEEEISKEDVNVWKKNISETISLLRNEGSRIFESFSNSKTLIGIDNLTEQLISSYS